MSGPPLYPIMKKVQDGGITQDFIAHWPFNGNANDESGNGHNGTVTGATLINDRKGNANSAYDFDGNDLISVPAFVRGGVGLTLSTWINPRTQSATAWVINHRGLNQPDINFQLIYDNITTNFVVTDGVSFFQPQNEFSYTEWTHLLATTTGLDGDEIELFINNNLVDSVTLTGDMLDESELFIFGRATWDSNFGWFKGAIDDTYYYNRKLNAAERTALFEE